MMMIVIMGDFDCCDSDGTTGERSLGSVIVIIIIVAVILVVVQ